MTVRYERALLGFLSHMDRKLSQNTNKRSWRAMSNKWLINRLVEKVEKLKQAVDIRDPLHTVSEAANVANLAMMIADKGRGFHAP